MEEGKKGVFTKMVKTSIFDFAEVNAIRADIPIKTGDMMDFNSYMSVAQATAKHLGYDDIEKRIEAFYGHFAGKPITTNNVIMFWLMLMKGLKE